MLKLALLLLEFAQLFKSFQLVFDSLELGSRGLSSQLVFESLELGSRDLGLGLRSRFYGLPVAVHQAHFLRV